MELFVRGSWQFPYLFTVPLNTVLSAVFLFHMVSSLLKNKKHNLTRVSICI